MAGKRSVFRNLLVGKDHIPSRLEFKYALLRGQFAIIIFSIGVFYTILDPINNVYDFIPGYVIMMIVAGIIIFLNRKKLYNASSILLLLFANTIVFFYCTVDHPHGGLYFFFMTCSVAADPRWFLQPVDGFVFCSPSDSDGLRCILRRP